MNAGDGSKHIGSRASARGPRRIIFAEKQVVCRPAARAAVLAGPKRRMYVCVYLYEYVCMYLSQVKKDLECQKTT